MPPATDGPPIYDHPTNDEVENAKNSGADIKLARRFSASPTRPASLRGYCAAHRGRAPRVPSFGEREEISRGIAAGDTLRAIARGLHRAVSTVSQEVARHGGREGYRAAHADQMAWDSARRPKPCVLARSPRLQRIVAGKLKQDWSPQQIAGWLRDQYPESPEMWCHTRRSIAAFSSKLAAP